jgi:hypothetical protein
MRPALIIIKLSLNPKLPDLLLEYQNVVAHGILAAPDDVDGGQLGEVRREQDREVGRG